MTGDTGDFDSNKGYYFLVILFDPKIITVAKWVSMAGTENAMQHHGKHAPPISQDCKSRVGEHARHNKNNGEEEEKRREKTRSFQLS
jgi:hypothetical protein